LQPIPTENRKFYLSLKNTMFWNLQPSIVRTRGDRWTRRIALPPPRENPRDLSMFYYRSRNGTGTRGSAARQLSKVTQQGSQRPSKAVSEAVSEGNARGENWGGGPQSSINMQEFLRCQACQNFDSSISTLIGQFQIGRRFVVWMHDY
jgi:hypothetical protein